MRDRKRGTTRRVSVSSAGKQANGGSGDPSISADGRFVAFASAATNLVAGDTNGTLGHLRARPEAGHDEARERVERREAGERRLRLDPSISADGRFVAFASGATNLVAGDTNGTGDVFVRDRKRGHDEARERVERREAGEPSGSGDPSISADGRFVAFDSGATNLVAHDTNGTWDVFVRGPLR